MSSTRRERTGHVIVCGLHGVGLRTVEQLHLAGVPVVVVDDDPDPRLTRTVSGWGIPLVRGSSRATDTLLDAGLPGATAVVCVEPDDLHALETALLVRQLRPDVRLAVELSNAAVGRAVADVTGAGSVIDVAALAAPSVVEACLERRTHPIDLGGEEFLAAEVTATADGTLRELYGDLAPIAVVPAEAGEEDAELVVCPGRDHAVRAGDRITALGTRSDFADRGLKTSDTSRTTGQRPHRPNPLMLARTMIRETDPALRFTISALITLMALSVCMLLIGYRKPDGSRMSLLDALYFTVETVGTIGYGDFSFAAQDDWLRAYAVGFMITGAMLAAISFALLTNLLISKRIAEALGRGEVGKRSGHVIVVGLGAVGIRTVEGLLAEGRDVVVVDRDENNRYLAQARALKVPVVIADATLPQTLQTVNLPSASAVAVLTSDDLVNIETGLVVRDQLGERWSEVPVVLRLFDRQLATTVERSFGFGHVRSTAALAAPWFVGAALGLDVLGTFYVEHQPFLIAALSVATGGGLDGLAMQDLSARTRVIAISRAAGKLEHPPRSGTRFGAGDRAYLVGPYEELLQVLRRDALSPSQIPQ
ncbi:NAD-binding protein [Cryptosporangium phraense]|uniref:Potassium transporter TrkA n=1 Tax=Cryptosporangium phraense TaxID=2593070 RepID=A0A545AY93_9ACTN|nr:NAD-binding protein [Cryptosporangium phraense]TQS46290.1 potassium transporter TrkA [Cryptosporangium phraense]